MRDDSTTKPDRRDILRASSTLLVGGLAAGCSGSSGDGGSGSDGGDGGQQTQTPENQQTTSTQTQDLYSTKIAVSHYPIIATNLPEVMARRKNFFVEHGIDLQSFTSFSGGGSTIRGVVTGGLAASTSSSAAAMASAYMAGAPIHLAALEKPTCSIDFQVKPDSPIETIQDCKGKTIAVSNPGSVTEALVIRSMENADGITLDDVTIQYAGGLGEAITSMLEGNADVTWNIPPKSRAMLNSGKTRRVWHSQEYAPNIIQSAIGMGGILEQNLDAARGVMQAMADGMAYVRNNQTESAKVWAEIADLPEDLAISALKKDVRPKQTFSMPLNEEPIKATVDTMIKQGKINQAPQWEKFLSQAALPEDKRVDWF